MELMVGGGGRSLSLFKSRGHIGWKLVECDAVHASSIHGSLPQKCLGRQAGRQAGRFTHVPTKMKARTAEAISTEKAVEKSRPSAMERSNLGSWFDDWCGGWMGGGGVVIDCSNVVSRSWGWWMDGWMDGGMCVDSLID